MSFLENDLNALKLNQFRELFKSLPVPAAGSLPGVYLAAFVGPGWLRSSAGPALALSGLGGWWGKEFFQDGSAVNILCRSGVFTDKFRMNMVDCASMIDAQNGLSLNYQPGSPFPWMFIVDELRRMDDNCLLGMTMVNLPGLRGFSFPFILRKNTGRG